MTTVDTAVDYARLPGSEDVPGEDERNAEVALAGLVGRAFTAGDQPWAKVLTIAFIAVAAAAGWLIRLAVVPSGLDAAVASLAVAMIGLLFAARKRRPRKTEPDWARHARVHEEAVTGRLGDGTRQSVRLFLSQVRGTVRWQAVHLYIPRCTQQGPHYGPCCGGGTLMKNGRLLMTVGEHLFAEDAPLALAVMAHESRHVIGWRYPVMFVAMLADSLGVLLAGWAVPWPWLVPAVIGLHLAFAGTCWAVEISCDLGGARATTTSAMIASVEYKHRTRFTLAPPRGWKRPASALLTWVADPTHPPLGLRRWALRTLAG